MSSGAARTGRARSSGPFASALAALSRAYGRRRRPAGEGQIDRAVRAVLAEGHGERLASRLVVRYKETFVDWNEVRVSRPLDLAALTPEAPVEGVRRMRTLLQAIYENLGGLDLAPLREMKPSELRAWLGRLEGLSREEVEAILMYAFDLPTIPASEELARVLRRLGLVARRATRSAAQRAALRALAPAEHPGFYAVTVEHAATVCHAELPLCNRCRIRWLCRSKGRW